MILSKYSQVFIRNQNSWLKFPSLKVYEVIFSASLEIILSEFDCLSQLSARKASSQFLFVSPPGLSWTIYIF